MSYPRTGSTGDGYRLAQDIGHTIVKPQPSLVPLEIQEDDIKDMQGLNLKNVELTASVNSKPFARLFGEMMFTHFGVSGPIVLTLSKQVVQSMSQGTITLSINFKPALAAEQLEHRLRREFETYGKMRYKKILTHLLPAKAVAVFVKRSRIDPDKRGCDINREERKRLAELLSCFTMTVSGTRPIEEAIVTQGGIALSEINPKTMESKIVKGLFLCGEVIDVDGNTGGYNLQAAFSTGYVAGENAGRAQQG
jgi:predicted Rossmann fold flavoprotein